MLDSSRPLSPFKYFTLISMIFVTVSICDIIFVYRPIQLGPFIVTGGAFLMPLYYYLSDVIAEVYGYKYIRKSIWSMFFCCMIFSLLIISIINLPLPHDMSYLNYNMTFNHLIRATFGGTLVTILVGTFVNSYLISKWKILVKGKYFWMRSLGASAIGEAIEVFLECIILYAHIMPLHKIANLILSSYVIHITIGFIIIFPGAMLVKLLKILEGRDIYDYGISFNPFKLTEANEKDLNIKSTANAPETEK